MGGAVDTGSCAASRSKAECPGFSHPVPEGAAPIVRPLVQGLLPWPLDSGTVPQGVTGQSWQAGNDSLEPQED